MIGFPGEMGREAPLGGEETAQNAMPAVDLVMPAHNEGRTIGLTIREFYDAASCEFGIPLRFVVSEDGSTDDTCDVVRALADDLPVLLLSHGERKGYSRAVIDGLMAATADVVCFVDSDGQCDPSDLPSLLAELQGRDLVVGYRHPRRDSGFRKLISGAFKILYRILFPVRLRDPSCPYLLIRREALGAVLRGNPGILKQGFWWEFNARAAAAGLLVAEVAVLHRERAAGGTQVYKLGQIPLIAYGHVLGLFALRRELKALRSGEAGT